MSIIIRAALITLLSSTVWTLMSLFPKEKISARQIIDNMYTSVDKISSLKFKMKKKERVNGKVNYGEQDVKFVRHPKKIYTKIIAPNEGVEVLYVEGNNKNQAYINPNAFPYVTLSLDPYGSIMRKNNHHTIHEVGFDYIKGIVKYMDEKTGENFDNYFKYKGDTVVDNRKCYKVVIDYKPFGYYNYTVKKNETVVDIAYRYHISDYMIITINKLSDYDDVDPGQVIKIPNAYAKRTELCIDQQNFLPIVQVMYDEKGLFSAYEFDHLQVNPTISPEEFTKGYSGYNF